MNKCIRMLTVFFLTSCVGVSIPMASALSQDFASDEKYYLPTFFTGCIMMSDDKFNDGDVLIYTQRGNFAGMILLRAGQNVDQPDTFINEEYVPDNKYSPIGDVMGGAGSAAMFSDVADYLKQSLFRRAFSPTNAEMVAYAKDSPCAIEYDRLTELNEMALEYLRFEDERLKANDVKQE